MNIETIQIHRSQQFNDPHEMYRNHRVGVTMTATLAPGESHLDVYDQLTAQIRDILGAERAQILATRAAEYKALLAGLTYRPELAMGPFDGDDPEDECSDKEHDLLDDEPEAPDTSDPEVEIAAATPPAPASVPGTCRHCGAETGDMTSDCGRCF